MHDYSAYFLSREGFLAKGSTWPPRLLILVTVLRPARVEFLRQCTAEVWAVAWRGRKLPIGFAVHDEVCADGILEQPWTGLDQELIRLVEGGAVGAVGPDSVPIEPL